MKTSISHIWTALNYHRSPWKLQVSNMWTALNYHRSLCKLRYHISELRSIITIHNENFNITYLNCAKLSSFTTKTSISNMWTALNYHRSLCKLRYHNIWTALNYHHSQRKLQYHISELRSIITIHNENFNITYLNCAKLSSFTTKTSISDMWNGLNYRRSLWKLRYHISELR